MSEEETIRSIQSIILDAQPSCIEFVPFKNGQFVVGTYYLESSDHQGEAREDNDQALGSTTQSRSGSLLLYTLDSDTVYAYFPIIALGCDRDQPRSILSTLS